MPVRRLGPARRVRGGRGGDPVLFSVELETATGPLRGRVAIDPGPMRLADLVPSACELTEVLHARAAAREESAGRCISCGPACGACCRQMVPLSPPEALHLAEQVRALPEPRRAEIRARFEAIGAELERQGLVEPLLQPPDEGEDPGPAVALRYFRLGLPCPFLEAESCSIHPERPVACREYSVTTPARWCADPFRNPVRRVPMPVPLSAPLARLTARLTGGRARLVPLTLAPRFSDEHPELRERTWPGPELFQAFLEALREHREAEPGRDMDPGTPRG